MKLIVLSLVFFLSAVISVSAYNQDDFDNDLLCDNLSDKYYTFKTLCYKYGYPVETHDVTTEDGYILTMYRIVRRKSTSPRTPVLILHDMQLSSVDYIANLNSSLGFILANNGYDTWFGNFRGNYYSQRHVSLSIYDDEFWDFSFEDSARFDLPAFIDHVSRVSKNGKIFLIGHGQGATEFVVMSSLRSEYRRCISKAYLMGPMTYLAHVGERIKNVSKAIYNSSVTGEMLFDPSQSTIFNPYLYICQLDAFFPALCTNYLYYYNGDGDWFQCRTPVYFGHTPAGTSYKVARHFAQFAINRRFCRYDYGEDENMARYGQIYPPSYNISMVTTPVDFYTSGGDKVVTLDDVYKFASQLPYVDSFVRINWTNFTHVDFAWGSHAKQLVYEPILRNMIEMDSTVNINDYI